MSHVSLNLRISSCRPAPVISLPQILGSHASRPWVQILVPPCPHCSESRSLHLVSGVETLPYMVVDRLKQYPTKCLVQCLAHDKCSVMHSISLGPFPLGNPNSYSRESGWSGCMQRRSIVRSVNSGAKWLGSQAQLCHLIAV